MEEEQTVQIPLNAELDNDTGDMLCSVQEPKLIFNRQQLQGGYLPNSVRYESNGWMCGIYDYDYSMDTPDPVNLTLKGKSYALNVKKRHSYVSGVYHMSTEDSSISFDFYPSSQILQQSEHAYSTEYIWDSTLSKALLKVSGKTRKNATDYTFYLDITGTQKDGSNPEFYDSDSYKCVNVNPDFSMTVYEESPVQSDTFKQNTYYCLDSTGNYALATSFDSTKTYYIENVVKNEVSFDSKRFVYYFKIYDEDSSFTDLMKLWYGKDFDIGDDVFAYSYLSGVHYWGEYVSYDPSTNKLTLNDTSASDTSFSLVSESNSLNLKSSLALVCTDTINWTTEDYLVDVYYSYMTQYQSYIGTSGYGSADVPQDLWSATDEGTGGDLSLTHASLVNPKVSYVHGGYCLVTLPVWLSFCLSFTVNDISSLFGYCQPSNSPIHFSVSAGSLSSNLKSLLKFISLKDGSSDSPTWSGSTAFSMNHSRFCVLGIPKSTSREDLQNAFLVGKDPETYYVLETYSGTSILSPEQCSFNLSVGYSEDVSVFNTWYTSLNLKMNSYLNSSNSTLAKNSHWLEIPSLTFNGESVSTTDVYGKDLTLFQNLSALINPKTLEDEKSSLLGSEYSDDGTLNIVYSDSDTPVQGSTAWTGSTYNLKTYAPCDSVYTLDSTEWPFKKVPCFNLSTMELDGSTLVSSLVSVSSSIYTFSGFDSSGAAVSKTFKVDENASDTGTVSKGTKTTETVTGKYHYYTYGEATVLISSGEYFSDDQGTVKSSFANGDTYYTRTGEGTTASPYVYSSHTFTVTGSWAASNTQGSAAVSSFTADTSYYAMTSNAATEYIETTPLTKAVTRKIINDSETASKTSISSFSEGKYYYCLTCDYIGTGVNLVETSFDVDASSYVIYDSNEVRVLPSSTETGSYEYSSSVSSVDLTFKNGHSKCYHWDTSTNIGTYTLDDYKALSRVSRTADVFFIPNPSYNRLFDYCNFLNSYATDFTESFGYADVYELKDVSDVCYSSSDDIYSEIVSNNLGSSIISDITFLGSAKKVHGFTSNLINSSYTFENSGDAFRSDELLSTHPYLCCSHSEITGLIMNVSYTWANTWSTVGENSEHFRGNSFNNNMVKDFYYYTSTPINFNFSDVSADYSDYSSSGEVMYEPYFRFEGNNCFVYVELYGGTKGHFLLKTGDSSPVEYTSLIRLGSEKLDSSFFTTDVSVAVKGTANTSTSDSSISINGSTVTTANVLIKLSSLAAIGQLIKSSFKNTSSFYETVSAYANSYSCSYSKTNYSASFVSILGNGEHKVLASVLSDISFSLSDGVITATVQEPVSSRTASETRISFSQSALDTGDVSSGYWSGPIYITCTSRMYVTEDDLSGLSRSCISAINFTTEGSKIVSGSFIGSVSVTDMAITLTEKISQKSGAFSSEEHDDFINSKIVSNYNGKTNTFSSASISGESISDYSVFKSSSNKFQGMASDFIRGCSYTDKTVKVYYSLPVKGFGLIKYSLDYGTTGTVGERLSALDKKSNGMFITSIASSDNSLRSKDKLWIDTDCSNDSYSNLAGFKMFGCKLGNFKQVNTGSYSDTIQEILLDSESSGWFYVSEDSSDIPLFIRECSDNYSGSDSGCKAVQLSRDVGTIINTHWSFTEVNRLLASSVVSEKDYYHNLVCVQGLEASDSKINGSDTAWSRENGFDENGYKNPVLEITHSNSLLDYYVHYNMETGEMEDAVYSDSSLSTKKSTVAISNGTDVGVTTDDASTNFTYSSESHNSASQPYMIVTKSGTYSLSAILKYGKVSSEKKTSNLSSVSNAIYSITYDVDDTVEIDSSYGTSTSALYIADTIFNSSDMMICTMYGADGDSGSFTKMGIYNNKSTVDMALVSISESGDGSIDLE